MLTCSLLLFKGIGEKARIVATTTIITTNKKTEEVHVKYIIILLHDSIKVVFIIIQQAQLNISAY